MVSCKECGKEFKEKEDFQHHFEAKHKEAAPAPVVREKSNTKLYIGIGGVVVLVVFYFVFFLGGGGDDFGTTDQALGSGSADLSQIKILGNPEAPVTLTEYSDFQCPFCGRFFSQTEQQIIDEYVDSGDVKFVYKHYPVDRIHPQATLAALASECANEQGQFWEYHNILFQNQNSLGQQAYKAWASGLGLDTAQFNKCYDSKKYSSVVRSDYQEGLSVGVRGTPGFTVNGRLVSGAQPFSVFQEIIEDELYK